MVSAIIGPHGHFGTHRGGEVVLNGYKVDSIALFNRNKITYQWFDYILKNGNKPEILKDRINHEVMGANEWRSAPSLDKMTSEEEVPLEILKSLLIDCAKIDLAKIREDYLKSKKK